MPRAPENLLWDFTLNTTSYWDEKRDAGNVNASVINDPETGFGGNGVAPDFCIQDGPFVGYINGLGPLKQVNDHCIYRSHNNEASWWMSQEFVNYCYQFNDYASAFWCLKGGPHAGGHAAIGGLVSTALLFHISALLKYLSGRRSILQPRRPDLLLTSHLSRQSVVGLAG